MAPDPDDRTEAANVLRMMANLRALVSPLRQRRDHAERQLLVSACHIPLSSYSMSTSSRSLRAWARLPAFVSNSSETVW